MVYSQGHSRDLPFRHADGGRTAAGFKKTTGDCFLRALANYLGITDGAGYKRLLREYYKVEINSSYSAADKRKGKVNGSRYWHMQKMTQRRGLLWVDTEAWNPSPREVYEAVGNCLVEIPSHCYAIVNGTRLDHGNDSNLNMVGRILKICVDYKVADKVARRNKRALVQNAEAALVKTKNDLRAVPKVEGASAAAMEYYYRKKQVEKAEDALADARAEAKQKPFHSISTSMMWPFTPAVDRRRKSSLRDRRAFINRHYATPPTRADLDKIVQEDKEMRQRAKEFAQRNSRR